VLGFVAVTCATINVVGGFLITDRMLRMFKKKGPAPAAKARLEEGKSS
jgi:NAD(P) transhydrogenase subunit alpha